MAMDWTEYYWRDPEKHRKARKDYYWNNTAYREKKRKQASDRSALRVQTQRDQQRLEINKIRDDLVASGVSGDALDRELNKAEKIVKGRTYKCEIMRKDQRVVVHSAGRLAIELDRRWRTIKNWLSQKLLPPPTYVDDNGSPYFSIDYIDAINRALRELEVDGKITLQGPNTKARFKDH